MRYGAYKGLDVGIILELFLLIGCIFQDIDTVRLE
jgi:hypothetical protein